MEKKLKNIFDYQRFEHSEELDAMIRETENRLSAELSDDDLLMVAAAGEAEKTKENPWETSTV